jgi:competence protein ComEC
VWIWEDILSGWMNMTDNRRFKTIITIEITVLVVGLVCLLPAAMFFTSSGLFADPVITPTPQPQSLGSLQTQEAMLVSTLRAPLSLEDNKNPQIPITGQNATAAPGDGILRVTFIDVGQGDAALIQTPDGKYGLIDGGPANGKAPKYLQSHGVTSLELVVATVPRPEHFGGLIEILRTIPVGRVVTNGQPDAGPVYEEFLDAVAESGAVFTKAKRGDALYIGSQKLDVLHPGNIIAQDLAVNSLVLRLAHEKSVFLFMGDATNISDQEIVASVFPLKAPILKVGHHAGRQAVSPDFLSAVQPEIAVYSPGSGEDFDLPAADTIAALEAAGAEVYGTDSSGTVMAVSDVSGYVAASQFDSPQALAPSVEPTPVTPPGIKPAEFTVVVTELTSPVHPGETASISIETAPGAICANIMKFSTGRGGMTNLGTRVADPNGAIGWSWRVGTNATPGSFVIDILCGLDGRSTGGVIPFVVTR